MRLVCILPSENVETMVHHNINIHLLSEGQKARIKIYHNLDSIYHIFRINPLKCMC